MNKTNIPLKAAIGYGAVAATLIAAIVLVYSNSQSIMAINQASREYIEKRDSADNAMAALLREEQDNLKRLSTAMEEKEHPNYLHEKMRNLNTGKDSIVVHPKTARTHEAKTTTVEVVKTRKGFLRRLADAFRKEHAETLSVRQDSNRAVIDTLAKVNVAEDVADILEQIDQKEKTASREEKQTVSRKMADLQVVSAKLALQSAQQLNDAHQRERLSMQQTIHRAMEARWHLLWQMGLLAVIAIIATVVLLWHIWRDTRKERIYRENLEAANEETQRLMRQRERLLLTITHDIKAPAASISGFIDMLRQCPLDRQAISYLESIRSSATHLSQLVASLLDYHQLENGKMELHPVCFNPMELVAQCANEMTIQAQQKSLTLVCDTQHSANGPTRYRSDAFRIRQVLNNLVGNAIKYTDQDRISILASLRKDGTQEGRSRLVLKVKDTGKGMNAEECKKAFQAFTRLENAQGIEGTGLGLSITQELVTLLGGSIQLESAPGKGSTFTVTIPMEPCEEVPQENTQGDKAPEGTEKQAEPENHKILILDDDKLQLTLLQEQLRRILDGTWQVFACHHVQEALTVLHDERPALMLMDVEMPEMNGMDLISHINHSQMKVFAMTAHDESILKDLKQAGFDDCLFKPFNMDTLARKLGMEKKVENEEIVMEKPKKSRLDALLAFAASDPAAEQEIREGTRTEMENFLAVFRQATGGSIDRERIGKAAHQLAPVANMLQFDSVKEIEALSPERISQLDDATIQAYALSATTEMERIIEEINAE